MKFIKSMSLPSRSLLSDLWKYLAVLGFLYIALDMPFWPLDHGADNSWRWAINYFFQTPGYIYGRDIWSPYGPLYFLLTPYDIGNNLQIAIIFRVLLHCTLGGLLIYHVRTTRDPLQSILFLATLFGAHVFHHRYESVVMLTGILAISLAVREKQFGWLGGVITGFLSIFLFLSKLNLGFMMIGMTTLSCLLLLLLHRRQALLNLSVYYGTLVIALLVYSLGMEETPLDLLRWASILPEFFEHYTITDGFDGPRDLFFLGILSAGVYIITAVSVIRDKDENPIMAITLASGLFLVWKNAYTPEGTHLRHWYSFILMITSCLIIFSRQRDQLLKWVTAYVLCLILTVPIIMTYSPSVQFTHKILGRQARLTVHDTSHFKQTRRHLTMQTQKNQWATQIPKKWLALINQNDSLVDVIPWQLSYMASNPVRWTPSPLLQLFMSRTPALDARSASHFASDNPSAPDFLVVEYRDLRNYHAFWDAPLAWRAILDNYMVIDIQRRKGRPDLILMNKKPPLVAIKTDTNAQGHSLEPKPSVFSERAFKAIKETPGRFGEWIEVPQANVLLHAEFHLDLNLKAKVLKFLYHIPEIYIKLEHASGKVADWRLPAFNCESGILINAVPYDFEGLASLLSHEPAHQVDPVLRFRIGEKGAKYYDEDFMIQWRGSNYKIDLAQPQQKK